MEETEVDGRKVLLRANDVMGIEAACSIRWSEE